MSDTGAGRCSPKKVVGKDLAKCTGKEFCWGLFFNKVVLCRAYS